MLSDSTLLPQNPLVMPVSTSSNGGTATNGGVKTENVETKKATPEGANNFPPPKTDKPRPHVCDVQTCQRAFARLEHLKRHERSHTKEKPFECPECGRSFARRDLLLRHQQKLHMTTTPSSRPRNRRESAASTSGAAGRVRKASVANGAGSMRPRANTISHVDGTAALHPHMMAQSNVVNARQGAGQGHSRHASLIGLPQQTDYQFGGMSAALGQRGIAHGLPKLETNGFNNVDFSGLRTAPPMGGFPSEFDFEGQLFSSSTINPNALHYSGDSPMSMGLESPFPHHYAFQQDMSAGNNFEESFDWMPNGFDAQMNFNNHENAIDGSSPSAISTASHSGMSEVMLDGSNNPAMSASMWQQQQQPMMAPPLMTPNFNLDMSGGMDMSGASFPDLLNGGPMSPHTLPSKNSNDQYFSTPPPSMSSMSPLSMMPGLNANGIQQTMNFGPETPSSVNGSLPYSPLSTITDSTRQALVMALAQCTPFGGRKYSFPQLSSPLSPHFAGRSNSVNDASRTIPSTADLQRYIGAYIRYFHPHLPFLHIPTLSFDVPTNQGRSQTGMVGGRGCLILSMAAIGALYEMEHAQSKELFESGKKMIQLYIEERRKADVRKADMRKAGVPDHSSPNSESTAHTPVWLVQAMLLNVVYGHNCGDKISGDIASTHSAALVSLARAAELLRPGQDGKSSDTNMTDGETDSWKQEDEQLEWHNWLMAEERKRTLYSIFILSSLLVAAYNHAPVLTNSEILLDLPCEEEFWSSESAAAFQARGGVRMATHNQVTFHDALGELLRTSERQLSQQQFYTNGMNNLPQSDLKPSTFGCLVLINALHNYIWETRQRHHSKIWTNEETEKMHRHIEPALKAWQAAWASNPHHSLERPNPFGLGPLSADSIPLLDLAYVRLFVNLSRSKEKFWQRDYDGMAEELSGGNEIIQHAEHSPQSNVDSSSDPSETSGSSRGFDSPPTSSGTPDYPNLSASMLSTATSGPAAATMTPSSTKRERHLRKAAFYAADSLCMSDKLGVTFADFTSRELPLQSAMCAFDCAQVLAEWVATVQERVGSLMGVLGRDECDYTVVPGIMMLEDEDVKLLGKVHEVLASAEAKIRGLENNNGMNGHININAMNNMNGLGTPGVNGTTDSMANVGHIGTGGFIAGTEWGYGSRILKVTAYMLDKAAVWPVTHLMARALEIQANHMRARAENSVLNRREL